MLKEIRMTTKHTRSITPSGRAEKATCRVEKSKKSRPSRMRALLRRLTGRSKAREVDQRYPHRTLEQVAAQYAPDELPEAEKARGAWP